MNGSGIGSEDRKYCERAGSSRLYIIQRDRQISSREVQREESSSPEVTPTGAGEIAVSSDALGFTGRQHITKEPAGDGISQRHGIRDDDADPWVRQHAARQIRTQDTSS